MPGACTAADEEVNCSLHLTGQLLNLHGILHRLLAVNKCTFCHIFYKTVLLLIGESTDKEFTPGIHELEDVQPQLVTVLILCYQAIYL